MEISAWHARRKLLFWRNTRDTYREQFEKNHRDKRETWVRQLQRGLTSPPSIKPRCCSWSHGCTTGISRIYLYHCATVSNMVGITGLVVLVQRKLQIDRPFSTTTSSRDLLAQGVVLYYIIYQLCSKCLNMNEFVMSVALINYTRSRSLQQHQVQLFFLEEEIESIYGWTLLRCSGSAGENVLNRFYELREEVKRFM